MKCVKFTLILCVAAGLAACSKDHELTSENVSEARIGIASTKQNVVVTGWESGYAWNTDDSAEYTRYRHLRSTPELSQDIAATGAVLVWAKNLPSDEGGIISKHQILPLALIKNLGRPAYNNYWSYITAPGNITLSFRTNKYMYTQEPAPLPNSTIQFKYYIIPAEVLHEHGYTPATVARLTYEELVNEFGE